jgi:hypothetical protein
MSDNIINVIKANVHNQLENSEISKNGYEKIIAICESIELCIEHNDFANINDLINDKDLNQEYKNDLSRYINSLIHSRKKSKSKTNNDNDETKICTQLDAETNSDSNLSDNSFNTLLAKIEALDFTIKEQFNLKRALGIDKDYTDRIANNINSELLILLKPEYNKVIDSVSENISLANKIHKDLNTNLLNIKEEFSKKIKHDSISLSHLLIFIFILFGTIISSSFLSAKITANNIKFPQNISDDIIKKSNNYDIIISRINSMNKQDSAIVRQKLGFN